MNQYLPIGQVSKMEDVSITSLRYYTDFWILPPGHSDPESGCRYYNSDPLAMLDLIKVCPDLDIPLKNFKDYIEPTPEHHRLF